MVLRVGPHGGVLTETPVLPSAQPGRAPLEVAVLPPATRASTSRSRSGARRRPTGASTTRRRASGPIATAGSGTAATRARGSPPSTCRRWESRRAGHGAVGGHRPALRPADRPEVARAAGHRARCRLRAHLRPAVGAAAGPGARLSLATRRGADLPPAGGLADPGRQRRRRRRARGPERVRPVPPRGERRRRRGAGQVVPRRGAHRIAPDEYPRFRAFLGEIDAALQTRLVVGPGEAGS